MYFPLLRHFRQVENHFLKEILFSPFSTGFNRLIADFTPEIYDYYSNVTLHRPKPSDLRYNAGYNICQKVICCYQQRVGALVNLEFR